MKAAKSRAGSLVADFQSAGFTQPGHGALDHVARLAQATAVRAATHRQQATDHQPRQQLDDVWEAVPSVALQDLGFLSPRSLPVGQRRKLLEHRLNQFFVPLTSRANGDDQRDATFIGNHVPLATWLPAVGWVRSAVRPPFTARTEALSIMTRSMSIAPRWPRLVNSLRWTLSQTPALVRSSNRRQQVLGLTPNSLGSNRHAIPPLRSHRMPSRHRRSLQRGWPPLGEGRCFGSCGSTVDQSSSVSSVVIFASHPLRTSCFHANTAHLGF